MEYGSVRRGTFMAVAPICVALLCVPAVAQARTAIGAEVLTAFSQDPVVSKAELDRQRGGFYLPNGVMISLGVEIQQFVNNQRYNDVTYSVNNNFSVTQTTAQGTTTYTQTLLGGTINTVSTSAGTTTVQVSPTGSAGLTTLAASFGNGSIQSVIQNSANGIALKSITTVNLTTQGLANSLKNNMMLGNILGAIQSNIALFHH